MTVPTDGKPKNVNTGEIENWGLETNIGYRINPHWQVNATIAGCTWRIRWLPLPNINSYAGVDFTQGRWGVSTGVQYIKTFPPT